MSETFQRALDFLRSRKRAYQLIFRGAAGNEVLSDLARFCRANESCYHDDPRKHAVAEGRREVWLRIQRHLHLSGEDLISLYAGKNILRNEEVKNDA